MGTATARYRKDFDVTVTRDALAPNLPQRIGTALWAPMLVMALMAFPLALILAIARANLIAQGGQPVLVAALGQYVPAAMFLGFASVFAAISFAIARILGVLRTAGGRIQAWISDLTIYWKPQECVERLYWWGFERDDDATEVHTQWVRHQTSPFSSLSTPR